MLAPDGTERTGLCACGCGRRTEVPTNNWAARDGRFKGVPNLWCHGHGTRGPRAHAWNGGKKAQPAGYVHVFMPEHAHADAQGYVYEHVLLAEKALGHSLPPRAVVHHRDEIKSHNVNENLVICNDQAHHMLLHLRMRAFRESGHADWLRCRFCKHWDDPSALRVRTAGKRRLKFVEHPRCRSEYEKARRTACSRAV